MHRFEAFITGCLILAAAIALGRGQRLDGYCDKYCYSLDHIRPQTDYFSSKTSYFIIKRQEVGKHFLVPSK